MYFWKKNKTWKFFEKENSYELRPESLEKIGLFKEKHANGGER